MELSENLCSYRIDFKIVFNLKIIHLLAKSTNNLVDILEHEDTESFSVLRRVALPVNNPHLFDEGTLSTFSRT